MPLKPLPNQQPIFESKFVDVILYINNMMKCLHSINCIT